jgi:hypothetical protein
MKPYNDFITSQYLYSIPKIELKLDVEDENRFRLLSNYGHKITMPTKTITVKVQKRTNKNNRINKKWLKRYGYKEIKKEVLLCGFVSSCGV